MKLSRRAMFGPVANLLGVPGIARATVGPISANVGCTAAVPFVIAQSVNLSVPPSNGAAVATMRAMNYPTSWAIVSNPARYAIDNSGNVTVAASGATGLTTTGVDTLTIQATNAAGSGTGSLTINKWADGFTNAPAGSPQLPTLLNSYGRQNARVKGKIGSVQPPWNVAGVDYAVGYPSGTALKDPFPGGALDSRLVALGGSANTGNHVITFAGVGNIIIDGYDFSRGGGWTVQVNGDSPTIRNCNFLVGANGRNPITIANSANNPTVAYNVIDGAGNNSGIGVGLIQGNGQGTTRIEYNWIKNAFAELIVLGNASSGTTVLHLVQFNLCENSGLGASLGAHGDWVQEVVTPGHTTNEVRYNFNTWIQNLPFPTQGLSLFSANMPMGQVLSETVANNTMLSPSRSVNQPNYMIIIDNTWLNGTGAINQNYIDPTGVNSNWDFVGKFNSPDGPFNGTVTKFGNINMVSGAILS